MWVAIDCRSKNWVAALKSLGSTDLTPWDTVLLEKLTVAEPVQKFQSLMQSAVSLRSPYEPGHGIIAIQKTVKSSFGRINLRGLYPPSLSVPSTSLLRKMKIV
jgi:hypothetical protein